MCLEDLRLGKGRQVGQRITTAVTLSPIFGPNANRVALLVSWGGVLTWDSTGVIVFSDQLTLYSGDIVPANVIFFFVGNPMLKVLRIEDLGQLITGAISCTVGNSSGFGTLTITEIISEVEAPAVFTGKP